MRRMALATICAAGFAVSLLVIGAQSGGIIGRYRELLSPINFILWMSGLFVATLGPPVIAITFWSAARRFHYGWVLHVMFVPAIFAMVQGCVALMLFVADEPDSDGLTGWATDPALLLMVICLIAYALAIALRIVHMILRR